MIFFLELKKKSIKTTKRGECERLFSMQVTAAFLKVTKLSQSSMENYKFTLTSRALVPLAPLKSITKPPWFT